MTRRHNNSGDGGGGNGNRNYELLFSSAMAVSVMAALRVEGGSSNAVEDNDGGNNPQQQRTAACNPVLVSPLPLSSSSCVTSCQSSAAATSTDDVHNDAPFTTNSVPSVRGLNDKNSPPRNVTAQRMRSIRARNLDDKYRVDWKTVLGEGAYGSVHPARVANTGEKVALKKISKQYTDTSSFRRETDALLRIYSNGGHPSISGLRDMYEDFDHYYLVMDLVSGGEMFDHLIEYGAYSEADAARLMREVASALAFLHGVGVSHADLKPENLLLCSKRRANGTIKMIDFGCAVVNLDNYHDDDLEDEVYEDVEMRPKSRKRWLFQDIAKQRVEVSSHTTGTTAYWPPERFHNKTIIPDPRSDMWAVGIILFIMLTGVHPFDLTGVAPDSDIEEQIKRDPSPPITHELTSHLSPSAIDLLRRLFAPDPKERITANEMLQHPWIAGDEATTDVMEKSAQKLSKYKNLRAVIEAGIFSILIEQGNRDMALNEYTPHVIYNKDGKSSAKPGTSVIKRAFEIFDKEGKGFVTAEDLGRVADHTGKELSESDRVDMRKATRMEKEGLHKSNNEDQDDTSSSNGGLSLSDFSQLCGGLKHKHYPKGHIIFRAGDIGTAMFFINSGKVEIQTRKGQLVHILRHGDFFGEGSMLEKKNHRFSTAKCTTPVDVIKIKRSDFERYIEDSPTARDTLRFKWRARSMGDAKAMIRLQANVSTNVMKKGDVVYTEGDMGKSMYFVDEDNGGEFEAKHGDITVHHYGKGESFGESSLLMERPRSSTVICSSETCILHDMKSADFHEFLKNRPETKAILENMCRKRLFKRAVKAYLLGNKRGLSNDDLTKAFEEADIDNSGDLSLDEVRKLMHAMDPTIAEKDIVGLLKFIDVDEDGKLNFNDFKRIFRQFGFKG